MTGGNSLNELLTIYLYKNKYLSLPKLGRFDVAAEEDLSQPDEIQFSRIPKGVITFTSNPSEETDTDLIKYITGHTRKMQSLAVADLFTLTDQAVQMLNILQSVSFPGIGTLSKNVKGEILFAPGAYRPELLRNYREGISQPAHTEKTPSPGNSLSSLPSNSSPSRSMGGIVIIIVCIAVAAVLVYFMFSHHNDDKVKDVTTVEKNTSAPAKDSSAQPAEKPASAHTAPKRTGIIHYEVIFEHATSERALKRYHQLTEWGHHIILKTEDSVHYTLAVPFTSPAADTSRVKDSIQVFYGHPTSIRYKTGG